MRTVALLIVVAAAVACRAAPEPVARELTDESPASVEGLPEEWSPWVGFDEWREPRDFDWRAYLEGNDERGATELHLNHPGEGCLFEVVHRDGDALRRWHVLVRPDSEGGGLKMGSAVMDVDGEDRTITMPLFFTSAEVTVAPEGREIAPTRRALLPLIAPRLGYVVGADEELPRIYEELESSGAVTEEVSDRYVSATSKPIVSLLSLFKGIQEHPELSEILREVVDVPSILSIVLSGGLSLTLEPDLESMEVCDCAIGPERVEPGVRFPASIKANGDPALEMEIYATHAVRPVHMTGGLVALRAWLPGDESNSVDLRIIGARDVAAK